MTASISRHEIYYSQPHGKTICSCGNDPIDIEDFYYSSPFAPIPKYIKQIMFYDDNFLHKVSRMNSVRPSKYICLKRLRDEYVLKGRAE